MAKMAPLEVNNVTGADLEHLMKWETVPQPLLIKYRYIEGNVFSMETDIFNNVQGVYVTANSTVHLDFVRI